MTYAAVDAIASDLLALVINPVLAAKRKSEQPHKDELASVGFGEVQH